MSKIRRSSNETTYNTAAANYTCARNMTPQGTSSQRTMRDISSKSKPISSEHSTEVSVKFEEFDVDLQDTTSNTMMMETMEKKGQYSELSSYSYKDKCADVMLKSSYTGTRGWLPWPEQLKDHDSSKYSDQSSDHSYMDECGWLPWPEQKDNVSSNRTGDESWEYLNEDETVSFLPWPGTPDENWHAGDASKLCIEDN